MKRIGICLIALLAVVALTLGLFACNGADGDKIKVSFDDTVTYTAGDVSDIAEILKVADKSGKELDFEVVRSNVSEDGEFIEVVISVGGKEQIVSLPYGGPAIGADVFPLYTLLLDGAEKCYNVELSAKARASAEEEMQSFGVKAIVNMGGEDGMQVALFTGKANEQGVFTYDNTVLALGGIGFDASKASSLFALLMNRFGDEEEELFEDDAMGAESDLDGEDDADYEGDYEEDDDYAYEGEDDEPLVTEGEEEDLLTALFVKLSYVLGILDEMADAPLVGVTIAKTGNDYSVNADLSKVFDLLSTYFASSEDFKDLDVDAIKAAIDDMTDGALSEGKVKVALSVECKEDGVAASFRIANEKSGAEATVALSFAVSDSAFAIAEDVMGEDIEITVPITLAKKETSLGLDAVLHTSDLFAAGKDIVTASLKYNEVEDAVVFVLNDKYMYLDATEMMKSLQLETMDATFYEAFEIDGEPASFFEALPYLLISEDDRFDNGYGVTVKDADNDVVVLTVGATEDDLRDAIFAYVYDEDGEMVEFSEYTIEMPDKTPFDGSKSFGGTVQIVFSEKYDPVDLTVRVYDPKNTIKGGISAKENYYPVGTTLVEAARRFAFKYRYTDGTVYWTEGEDEGVTFGAVLSSSFAPVTGEVFSERGDYYIWSVEREGFSLSFVPIHVYDPENLEAKELKTDLNSLSVNKDTTEEDIRNALTVSVVYDDTSTEVVTDYTLEGTVNAEGSLRVKWEGVSSSVYLIMEEESDGTALGDYLRFITLDEEEELSAEKITEIIAAAKGVYEENKELFDAVFTKEITDTGIALHVLLNDAQNRDLLAIVNLFLGIPGDEGFEDITEAYLLEKIAAVKTTLPLDVPTLFGSIVGIPLADVLQDVACDLTLSWKDGISLTLVLKGGEEAEEYLSAGITVKTVPAATANRYTEESLVKTQGFDTVMNIAYLIGMQLFME